nr:MAG TPA: hypothetical protein [Caudoviricetes sp.]
MREEKRHRLSMRLSTWLTFLGCLQTISLEEKIFRVPTHGGHAPENLCYRFIGAWMYGFSFHLLSTRRSTEAGGVSVHQIQSPGP